MIDKGDSRNPIDVLAEEFTERHRHGETPSISDYVEKHPDLAEEIRQLFPTIVAMERLKHRKLSSGNNYLELKVRELKQLGDYRIVCEIGRGGMGIVYEAEQESLGRRVAVKVLPEQSLLNEKHLERFQREAQTAAKLHHTNIVPIFGVGEEDGLPYIVMQQIRGVSLDDVLCAFRRFDGRVDNSDASDVSVLSSARNPYSRRLSVVQAISALVGTRKGGRRSCQSSANCSPPGRVCPSGWRPYPASDCHSASAAERRCL